MGGFETVWARYFRVHIQPIGVWQAPASCNTTHRGKGWLHRNVMDGSYWCWCVPSRIVINWCEIFVSYEICTGLKHMIFPCLINFKSCVSSLNFYKDLLPASCFLIICYCLCSKWKMRLSVFGMCWTWSLDELDNFSLDLINWYLQSIWGVGFRVLVTMNSEKQFRTRHMSVTSKSKVKIQLHKPIIINSGPTIYTFIFPLKYSLIYINNLFNLIF